MKRVVINEDRLNLIIAKMERNRDEHFKGSAEWVEEDSKINSILAIIIINSCVFYIKM